MRNNYDPVTYRKAMRMALDNQYLTEEWELKQCAKAMYHAMKWDESTREIKKDNVKDNDTTGTMILLI